MTGYRFSDAAPHDSNFIDELTEGETKMLVGDTVYHSAEREIRLRDRGACCAIVFKRLGQKELPRTLAELNRLIASVRAPVEHPFAWMRSMGYRHARYRGRRRNEVDSTLNLIAYN